MSEKSKIAILTGAGFSREWGGLLTQELTYHALAYQGLSDDARTRLLDSNGNFELALGGPGDEVLQAVSWAFKFHENLIELGPPDYNPITRFLRWLGERMDEGYPVCWFSLNYDFLIERASESARGSFSPLRTVWRPGSEDLEANAVQDHYVPHLNPSCNYEEFMHHYKFGQESKSPVPLIKLHGSRDWIDEEGNVMLVAGHNVKDSQINKHTHLRAYKEWFDYYLPGSRTVVLGYGFGDSHVNDALFADGSRFISINPAGRSAVPPSLRQNMKFQKGFYRSCHSLITRAPSVVLREGSSWYKTFDDFVAC